MKKLLIVIAVLSLITITARSQNKCGNNETYKMMMSKHPQVYANLYSGFSSRDDDNTVYTIPVVVHVVWKN